MEFKKLSDLLIRLVYPPDIYCIACGKPVDRGHLYSLCDDCLNDIVWSDKKTCAVCGKPLESWYPEERCSECLANAHYFERGVTCFLYGGVTRSMIGDLKYHGRGYLARFFGRMLADRIIYEGMDFDLCTSVPMYEAKERARGYNQASLIASFAADLLGKPYADHLLLRTRNTVPMNTLNAAERRKNLKGAFALAEGKADLIKGRTVLLVDDIYTTGATMDACARELLQGGAAHVYIASMASGRNQRKLPEDPESGGADLS